MSISRHQAVGAYRPWAPPAFDEAEAPPAEEPTAPEAVAADPEPAAAEPIDPELFGGISLPTAEELERMHEEARAAGHDEGYAAGEQAGREAGYQAGHEEGLRAGYAEGKTRAEEEATRLGALIQALDTAVGGIDAEISEEVLALAIEIARQMVQHTLLERPEAVVETVRSALAQLPQNHAQIRLHPDDAALVREHLGEQLAHAGQRVVEDATVTPGGCRIDSPAAHIDATMETRWRRILQNLGRDHAEWPGEA